ncbi:MAG: cytochrome c-552 precursor [Gammaproteobacteria bacterium]|nr:cytochrome c-552 precursor [Gammaproteobacteria bacterium]
MKRFRRAIATLGAVACALILSSPSAWAVSWGSVKGLDIVLFYPGQASWEWVLSDHSAAKTVRTGGKCRECHDTEETDMGKKMVTGKKMEPAPIVGKPGSIPVNIKIARDAARIYVRMTWKDTGFHSGTKKDADHPVKVAMMMANKQVKESSIAGCWGACHDDASGMASAADAKRSLYLGASRTAITRRGGGDNVKPDAELASLVAGGNFLEFWQAEVKGDQSVNVKEGYILDKRNTSKTPLVEASAELKSGQWSVTLSRKLKVDEIGRHNIQPDQTYNIGFALHDDYAEGRIHYVSFGYTLALNQGDTDFVAVKQ